MRLRVCRVDELPDGEMRRVDCDPPVVVYNVDGELHATADTCTHMESSLSEDGYLDGDVVECGWHMAKFCVRTGNPLTLPATEALPTYSVELVDGEVFVEV